MAKHSIDELREAYEHFSRVSDECAASRDYNAFADLFIEDCIYIEHVFGEMHGREAVRQWIVPLMQEYPNDQMTYTARLGPLRRRGRASDLLREDAHAGSGRRARVLDDELVDDHLRREQPMVARRGHIQPGPLRHPAH